MARENIYQVLEVYYEKIDECPLRDRTFNFFEMVYVLSGKGKHSVNGNTFDFEQGDLFIITPNDYHGFTLAGYCEFMVIRFGEQYIKEYQWKSIDHIECLLYNASSLSGTVLRHEDDKEIVNSLMDNLRQIVEKKTMYNEDITRHLVNAILVISARNIATRVPLALVEHADNKIVQILNYIQENICTPHALTVVVIAENFGLSPTYLGNYFRKQCNESLPHYISSYKIRLIEHRLRFSDKRIVEIADEFGFTDESHVNKFFKRHKNMSLTTYRQSFKAI